MCPHKMGGNGGSRKEALRIGGHRSKKVKPRVSLAARGTQLEHSCPLVVRVWKHQGAPRRSR